MTTRAVRIGHPADTKSAIAGISLSLAPLAGRCAEAPLSASCVWESITASTCETLANASSASRLCPTEADKQFGDFVVDLCSLLHFALAAAEQMLVVPHIVDQRPRGKREQQGPQGHYGQGNRQKHRRSNATTVPMSYIIATVGTVQWTDCA